MKKTIAVVGIIGTAALGLVTLTSTDDYQTGDNICAVKGYTESSIAIRAYIDGAEKDYGVFNISRQVMTNTAEYEADPENVEPIYTTETENNFTDYFGEIDFENYDQATLNEACRQYLNDKQGFNL